MKSDVTILSDNYSRRTAPIDTILIHTTQGHNRDGLSDVIGLGNFFIGASDVSAHVGCDLEGHEGRYVRDRHKAWTSGDWNSRSLNIELIGFAEWKNWYWRRNYRRGLSRAAKRVAHWSIKHGIPIRKQAPNGVAGHVDISGPGGHWDPGPGFPWRVFLLWSRLWKLRLLDKRPALRRRWRRIVRRRLRR